MFVFGKIFSEKKIHFVVTKITLHPLYTHTQTFGECSEISIVVCVFGDKQSEKTILCDERDKQTKSNRLAFLCKENSNTVKGGESEGFQPVGGCRLKGVQAEVSLV